MLMLSYKLKGQKSAIMKIALVRLFGRWYIRTQSVAQPVFSFNFGKKWLFLQLSLDGL